jgi:hypothetical protein
MGRTTSTEDSDGAAILEEKARQVEGVNAEQEMTYASGQQAADNL